MITANMVRELREKTGVGMMDCKRALTETNGDMEKAIEFLREKGLAKAAKKSGRITAEGIIGSYVHGDGRIAVLVEVNVETDFAAKNDIFRDLVKNIAMQITASKPTYVRREEVPSEVLDKEKEILKLQAINEGKPEHIAEKMVNGRIEKFYKENCLMDQEYIKDPDKNITQVINEAIAVIGENISVRRFVRFEVGEGMQKREENFAEEVKKQING